MSPDESDADEPDLDGADPDEATGGAGPDQTTLASHLGDDGADDPDGSEAGSDAGPEAETDASGDGTADAGDDGATADAGTGADPSAASGASADAGTNSGPTDDAVTEPTTPEERVALAADLLGHVEREVTVKEALDRVETVTTNPRLQRRAIGLAAERGTVERSGGTVRPTDGGSHVSFERDVVRKEGEFTCERCGAGLSTGHFVRFDGGAVGPFGSTCVRKVLGRE